MLMSQYISVVPGGITVSSTTRVQAPFKRAYSGIVSCASEEDPEPSQGPFTSLVL